MATNSNIFGESSESENDLIPAIDPADCKSVWEMQRELQARVLGQQIMIGVDSYKSACSPGADARAVFDRVSQLHLLQMLGILAPWMHDGVFNDAVFKVVATFHMKRLQVGVVYHEFPFDVQEFLKQIEEQSRGR
jgi:hypothetical protein